MPSQFTDKPRHRKVPPFADGRWNVVCDRCGFWFTSDDIIQEERTNLIVCLWCCNPVNEIIDYPQPSLETVVPDYVHSESSVAPNPAIEAPICDPYTNWYNT